MSPQVMMGGAWFQDEFGSPETVTEERLLARAAEAVRIHLQVNTAPCWSRVVLQKVKRKVFTFNSRVYLRWKRNIEFPQQLPCV